MSMPSMLPPERTRARQARTLVVSAGRSAVRTVAAATDRFRPPPWGIVFLIYHQVAAPKPGVVNLPLELFTEQMEELAASRRVIGIDDAVSVLNGGDASALGALNGDRGTPVVLTFDDGTADFVDHALPVLERLRLPAVLYVATKWVDEQRSFWDDGTVLTWSGVREAASSGVVTIGSHTHGHVHADTTPLDEFVDDLDRSIDLLGTHVGEVPRHFAYPRALPPAPDVDAAVRARFASAAIGGCQPNVPGETDPYSIWRSPLQVGDAMTWFRRKADGGMHLEDRIRSSVGAVRAKAGVRSPLGH